MEAEKYQSIIEKYFGDSEKIVKDFLSIPNIITEIDNVHRATHFLCEMLKELGAKVEVREYGELPIIYGELDEGADRTAIIYKNYDIVRPEQSGWKFNAFGAHVSVEPGIGDVIYGSGAAEPKGPLASLLAGLIAYKREMGKLPVNLKFIFECDEQIGSPNLPKLVQEKKASLMNAVVGIFPEFHQTSKGDAIIPLSVKGIVYIELICRGGDWGGPSIVSLHSSNASWIKSPVWRLIRALDSMVDSDENILISGFHEDLKEMKFDRETIATSRIKDIIDYMNKFSKKFKFNLDNEELFCKYAHNPTLNISSIMTFQSRRWMKFVLPHEIRARIDIRLVPDMDPDKVIQSIREHLDGYGYKDIEMLVHMKYAPWSIDANNEMVKLLVETYKDAGVESGFIPCSGTSLPLYIFDKMLEKPLVILGLGRAGRAYQSNEYLPLESIKKFQLSIFMFLDRLSRQ